MKTRLVWVDSGDDLEVDAVLSKIREKCPDHDWYRFDESSYDSTKEAKADFQRIMDCGSLFGDGRVVYTRGSTSFADWIAESMPCPDGNLLVVIAPPNKKDPLYALAKKQKSWAVVSESEPLTRGGADEWIVKRASRLGASMDEAVARMLVDKVGTDKNRLTLELRKLSLASSPIMAWTVEQLSFGDGQGDVRDFLNAMAKGDGPTSHELLDRLLAKGDWPIGAVCDWLRKTCIAESCGGKLDDEVMRKAASLRKASKEDGKPKKDKDGNVVTTPFFPNPRALYYSCKEIASRPKGWAFSMMSEAREVQVRLRKARSAASSSTIMHAFVERLLGG